ncbi:MAG: hypothetical protein WA001_05425 [Patescibacteria group bacterium]
MHFYYHTQELIIAIANGYCTRVFGLSGLEIKEHAFRGKKFIAVDNRMCELLEEDYVDGHVPTGTYLKFPTDRIDIFTMTGMIQRIEQVPTFSIPPRPTSDAPPVSMRVPHLPNLPSVPPASIPPPRRAAVKTRA